MASVGILGEILSKNCIKRDEGASYMLNFKVFSFSLILALAAVVSPRASARDDIADIDDLESRIDDLMQDYDGDNIPGAAVAIYSDEHILFQKNYGLRNLESRELVTSDTNFRTASLTKAFTATAILQLVEAEKVQLQASLTEIFKDFPTYGKGITLHHLLSHTSGLLDYENLLPSDSSKQVTDRDVLEIMKRQRSTYFSPGTRFRYSNTGYAILAEIVSAVSGKKFHQYLVEHIFEPLGMDATLAYVQGENSISNRAYGYSMLTSGYKRSDQSQTSAVLGDGGIYSSTMDLRNWHVMWTGGSSVLTSESSIIMTTPKKLNNGSDTQYGYGWFVDMFDGNRRISHTGSTVGQKHSIAIFPEKKLGIVILTNRQNSAPWLITDKLAHLLLK
jgi:CubicO group peptidase (beta-lactamase class C family)